MDGFIINTIVIFIIIIIDFIVTIKFFFINKRVKPISTFKGKRFYWFLLILSSFSFFDINSKFFVLSKFFFIVFRIVWCCSIIIDFIAMLLLYSFLIFCFFL